MSEPTQQSIADYYSLINGLARFLSREDERGYVFACADYQPLEQEVSTKLQEKLRVKGKRLLSLRLQKDKDRSVRAQIESAIAEAQPDALLIQGLDELLSREVTTGALTVEGARAIDMLNYAREALNELDLPIVFWLSRRNLTLLGNRAADLFAQRRRSVFFFTYQPELEADTPLLQSRFRDDYRSSEDYKQLRLQVNLLEAQLKEAEQKGYSARRIAREIALPLAAKYSELDLHERAAELLDTYDEAFDPTNPQLLKQLADIAYKAGKYAEAEQYIKLAMGQLPEGERTVFKADLLFDLGDIYSDIGQLDKALEAFGESRLLIEALIAEGYDEKRKLAVRLKRLGTIHQALGQFDKALDFFLKRSKLGEELLADNPHNVNWENGLAISYYQLAELYRAQGSTAQAKEYYEKAIVVWEGLYERTRWGQIGGYLETVRERVAALGGDGNT